MSFEKMDSDKPMEGESEPLQLRCGDCSGARVIRREFAKQNLWMTGDTSLGRVNWIKAFGASRFKSFSGIPFLIYRFALACLGTAIWIWSVVYEETDGDSANFGYWLYFLTHWMLSVHALALTALFVSTAMTNMYGETSDIWKTRKIPHPQRIAWVSEVIGLPGGLFVVLLFWLLLKGDNQPLSVLSHGGLWAFVTFDFLVIGMQPYVLVQFVWCVLFGLAYGTWTLIFYGANLVNKENNRWIYAPIKWETAPGTAAFWAFGSPFVILIPMYTLFWSFNFFRKQAIYQLEKSPSDIVSTGGPIVGAGMV